MSIVIALAIVLIIGGIIANVTSKKTKENPNPVQPVNDYCEIKENPGAEASVAVTQQKETTQKPKRKYTKKVEKKS